MKEITKSSRLLGQLEKLYRMINSDLFNGELQPVTITVQSTPRAYGHIVLGDAWSVKGEGSMELNIGAGTLDRPIEEVVATLVHECCHLLNFQNGISDCYLVFIFPFLTRMTARNSALELYWPLLFNSGLPHLNMIPEFWWIGQDVLTSICLC